MKNTIIKAQVRVHNCTLRLCDEKQSRVTDANIIIERPSLTCGSVIDNIYVLLPELHTCPEYERLILKIEELVANKLALLPLPKNSEIAQNV